MGLRLWSLEVLEAKAETLPVINNGVVAANNEPYSNGGDVIVKVLNMFDGEIMSINGTSKDSFEERAAILEFDGALTRKQAESAAVRIIFNRGIKTSNQNPIARFDTAQNPCSNGIT